MEIRRVKLEIWISFGWINPWGKDRPANVSVFLFIVIRSSVKTKFFVNFSLWKSGTNSFSFPFDLQFNFQTTKSKQPQRKQIIHLFVRNYPDRRTRLNVVSSLDKSSRINHMHIFIIYVSTPFITNFVKELFPVLKQMKKNDLILNSQDVYAVYWWD